MQLNSAFSACGIRWQMPNRQQQQHWKHRFPHMAAGHTVRTHFTASTQTLRRIRNVHVMKTHLHHTKSKSPQHFSFAAVCCLWANCLVYYSFSNVTQAGRDLNLRIGGVLQVQLQSWWFVSAPWWNAVSFSAGGCCLSWSHQWEWFPSAVALLQSSVWKMLRSSAPRKLVFCTNYSNSVKYSEVTAAYAFWYESQ